jgi:2-aminoadipate transaminase
MKSERHFSQLAQRLGEPPISWLMKLPLENPNLISLAVGFTDNETLPVADVREVFGEILREKSAAQTALQYGTTLGDAKLRAEIVKLFERRDQISAKNLKISPENVVVTNGSQQLLHLVSEILCDAGDIVLVEDPTYFVYLGIVEALGLKTFGVPMESDGLDADALESRLEFLKRKRLLARLKLIYLVTYFQNPTGRTLLLSKKRAIFDLVKFYEKFAGHAIFIVEDAAYRDLRIEGDDVPSFKSLDLQNERVVYANTLTKPFATGFKIGYGILPPHLLRCVLRSKGNHDFGSPNFLQHALARALESGRYDAHLAVLAARYRQKRDAMIDEICKNFPDSAKFVTPKGGLYVWVELPSRMKTGPKSKIFRDALASGVLYLPGEMCFCADATRKTPQNCMRLSYGYPPLEQIRKGVRALGVVLCHE